MIVRTVQGFLMMELLVTILIMVITSFCFMGYYTKTVIVQKDAELYLQATTQASEALEKVLSEKIIPSDSEQKQGLFTVSVKPLYRLDKDQFICVEVMVYWQSVLKTRRSLVLHSGFAVNKVLA